MEGVGNTVASQPAFLLAGGKQTFNSLRHSKAGPSATQRVFTGPAEPEKGIEIIFHYP